jgi:hypothetical protein
MRFIKAACLLVAALAILAVPAIQAQTQRTSPATSHDIGAPPFPPHDIGAPPFPPHV